VYHTYCIDIDALTGTLEVCDYIEKDNPRNSKFSKMKLYHRSEIRRRARERFGGLQGLIEERNKREFKRFERDYDEANNIFKSARACSSAKKKRKT
jgi:DNA-repair protein complementing XP-A cells